MKKQIANILTGSRIVIALAILFFPPLSAAFYIGYLACAVTDLIDGPIARKTDSVTVNGALMDTIGDVAMNSALIVHLLRARKLPLWAVIWIVCAGLAHISAGFYAWKKFGKFCLLHTFWGKGVGFFAFLFPLVILFSDGTAYLVFFCIHMSIAAIEAFAIHRKSVVLDPDILFYSRVSAG